MSTDTTKAKGTTRKRAAQQRQNEPGRAESADQAPEDPGAETGPQDGAEDASAIVATMRDLSAVAKRERNTSGGYNFRGIDSVLNAVGPAFRRHGITVAVETQKVEYGVGVTTTGKQQTAVRILATYLFTGPDGSSTYATVPGEAWDSGDKATPKAMSVAYRTALIQAFALPTDEPDPDSFTHEGHPQQGQQPDPLTAAQQRVAEIWQGSGRGPFTVQAAQAVYADEFPGVDGDPENIMGAGIPVLARFARWLEANPIVPGGATATAAAPLEGEVVSDRTEEQK